ncbi:MAG: DEAD/DEAH box helicase family protein [Clostridia bacterium]|nr:DEAD/DEAH box helicase family protein [Clostridia bacterium]
MPQHNIDHYMEKLYNENIFVDISNKPVDNERYATVSRDLALELFQAGHKVYEYDNGELSVIRSEDGIRYYNGFLMIDNPVLLDRAQTLISDFYEQEYGDESADFSNLHKVSLAYTTTEDGASEIQVDADLVDYRIIKYLDNHEVEREQFKDLYDMVENGLSDLNFDELVFMYESDIAAVIPEQDEQDISLAEQLVNFVREYNYYEYMDNLDVGSDHSDLVKQMSSELQSRENVQSLIESIKGSLPEYEEDDEYLERANSLISQLDGLLNQSQEYDIGFGSLGNGTTVWNRLEEVNGDYKTIAHIEDNGDVKYYEELPDDVKQRIERQAEFEKAIYQSINSDTPQRTRRNTEQINYDILTELAPELMDGDARYMRFQDKAMMPLIVEKLSDTRVSVAHTYILNGDVMYDPEMEFEIDRNTRSLSPRTYRQDDMGIYQYAELENGLLNTAFVTQFNSFARTWFKNIENTNYVRENATIEFNGEDISISYDENGNIAEISGDEEAVQQYKAEHPIPETAPEPEQHNDNNLIGKEVIMGERKFVVENINNDNVSLRDLTFEQSAGFPIFRNESLDTVRGLITEQGQETEHESEAEQHTEAIPMPQQQRPKPVSNTVIYPEITGERHNFRITDDNLGVAGPKDKFRNNVAAIELLHMLEEEHRLATPEEQEILSRYVGWGGLADAFDSEKDSWHSEYTQLKSLLTEAEYNSARESTLTAFYTPPVVIRSMYDALEGMGLKQANILDPSMGIGNFEGMLPDSLSECKMYGIEIDSISGRIAQQLYQNNSVAIQGYEDSALPDSFFDAAVGNVPFGQFKVMDKRYDKHNFLIHDYFFAKTIDKVRPGGVIAFVTSSGTMDKRNSNVRKYIAQRAELIGAIRLPDNTFKANAGTEVTSDILFLQKRDRMTDIEPDWVHLDTDEQGHTMNSYFVSNPDMILGEMVEESGPFGPQLNCKAYEGADLGEQLNDAIQNIHAQITEYDIEDVSNDEDLSIPADPSVRNFSYTVVDGDIYFRENSRMNKVDVSLTAQNRIKGLIEIRDCVRELIEYQSEDYPEHEIKAQQDKLNKLYDEYTAKYGLINSRGNNMAFSNDSSYFLLCSLEIINENGELERKADMFTKRTIGARTEITHVDTASEALAVSIGEKARVDMEYMSELTGMTEQELFEDLKGVVFLNPLYASGVSYQEKYLPADEYLSGNVREKLLWAQRSAELYPEDYSVNVEALTAVQPKDLTASEITVRLGTTWIPPEYIKEFVSELLKPSYFASRNIDIKYSNITGTWAVTGKNYDKMNVMANSTYGTKRANAYSIIEDSLNLKDVRIFDYVENEKGNRVAVLNQKETTIAQQKQDLIKNAFDNWIWSDPDRRMALTKLYNERFNSVRPREYDGSHIQFSGMNPEIQLRQHQKNAVARIMYGGNSLLGHVVGAGKTWTMAAAAMEMKRLGLCNKSLFVVPNHLTEQWAAEFLQLYPAANILVATKKDFETKNRKKFCGRIATGDYDAIIIGHSQFEKIPMSIERQIKMLENQRDEIIDGIIEAKANRDERFTIKQLEKTKRGIEAKLKKLNDTARKDDVVTFEELGVDRLFVDESHYYKNLYLYTKMRNVGGIAQTEAQKSSDMFMKCRYLDEITGGKGCIMATGTPISNSMVEMYTVQRYLQYDTLVRNELQHFDAWASTFGETVTAIELAPEGSGYRAKTRFAKFFNLPELMTMFKEVADIQTADMLKLPVPEAEYHNVAVQPTEIQKEMVSDLSDRAEKVRNRAVDPSVDNMLKITNDGRKLALDQRMINPMLADEEETKVNACMNNVYEIWKRTAADRSAQLVFCDLSTPKGEDEFSVYTDIKAKLIAKGVPENEIAFIHDADTDVKKKELFSKVRKGDVRILLGSTQKMGAGTNVQTRLIALHDLDCRATRS